jgi:hypothetical protein
VVLKSHPLKSEEADESGAGLYFSNKKINLHSNETIIEKLNALPESTRNQKTKNEFFKVKSKILIAKK